ncbi:MAG: hypothetical protein ACRD2A_12955, partial [Vicinamibacterales bacterium]
MNRYVTIAGNLSRLAARRTTTRARSAANWSRWALKFGLKKLKNTWHAARRAVESVRDHIINGWKAIYRWFRRPIRRAARRHSHLQERWGFYKTEWSIEREMEAVVSRDRLLIAGPWLSEVGFETLYWIPFLHWLKAAFHLDESRIVAVSRGGVGSWYQGVAGRYVEMWDEIEPADFARRNAARGLAKQYEPSDLDRHILDLVARRIGTSEFDVLHPGQMNRMFLL